MTEQPRRPSRSRAPQEDIARVSRPGSPVSGDRSRPDLSDIRPLPLGSVGARLAASRRAPVSPPPPPRRGDGQPDTGGRTGAPTSRTAASQSQFNGTPQEEQLKTAYAGYTPTPSQDALLLARILFAEAASKQDAYKSIGWTVINRIRHRKHPNSLRDVIMQPGQFDAVDKPLWKDAGTPSKLTGTNASAYSEALAIATGILNGRIPDPTEGATFFYHSPNGAPPPGFFKRAIADGRLTPNTDRPGDFTFLKEK